MTATTGAPADRSGVKVHEVKKSGPAGPLFCRELTLDAVAILGEGPVRSKRATAPIIKRLLLTRAS
jgi:hypothetical protein